MNKCYSYSVKDEISKYFHGDAVAEMRLSEPHGIKTERDNLIPRAWAFADDMAMERFGRSMFLTDTVLCDDCIAYFVKSRDGEGVLLSFMQFEDEPTFPLDAKYAYELVASWEKKGYKAIIMRNCVAIENYPNSDNFRFVEQLCRDAGTSFLIPTPVDGRYIFVNMTEPFWGHAQALMLSAISSGSFSEYESIFSEDAEIARCHDRCAYDVANDIYKNAVPFAMGIPEIKKYFESKSEVYSAYVKRRKYAAYTEYIVADNNKYQMFVGRKNQLVQLVEDVLSDDEEVIPVPEDRKPRVIAMPEPVGVRSLDIAEIYAYGIQAEFGDGCVKNYYISNITEAELPESVTADGYKFNKEVLDSARLVSDGDRKGVIFSNGYFIPNHLLYYRGVVQLIPEKICGTVFENESIRIEGKYRIPLKIRRKELYNTYQPRNDCYFGCGYALLDGDGNRTSDYSAYYIDTWGTGKREFYCTVSESSCFIGYLRKDGSWLAPPIFEKSDENEFDVCVKVEKDGKEYLLNELGELTEFPYKIDLGYFAQDLCEFSTGKYEGECTYPEEEYFDELTPGNWGFIDKYGKTVIEPQYVFTSGFGRIENRAFVAKVKDGKTLWGLIDNNGNEIIPCIYPNLATHHGTSVNFQRTEHGKYGIMDVDGNVIMEPRYDGIYEYNEKHGLIAAYVADSEGWVHLGVERLDDGKTVIPHKYGCIGFMDYYIECERDYPDENGVLEDYYDYDGNLLPRDTRLIERKIEEGLYCGRTTDYRYGAVDEDGNVVVPFVYREKCHVEYYVRGYVVTGSPDKYGLTTREGKTLLPERYRNIYIEDGFIKAERDNKTELYALDGTPIFSETYGEVWIKDGTLSRGTPLGEEYYRIVYKK